MLNELLIVERGARRAGIEMTQRHPDLKDARRIPTLIVTLNEDGKVSGVRPSPKEVTPWSFRDGNHNSFPFDQPKPPLLDVESREKEDETLKAATDRRTPDRRQVILSLAESAEFNAESFSEWPGPKLLARNRERRSLIEALVGTEHEIVPATLDRFQVAFDSSKELLRDVLETLLAELQEVNQDDWLDTAAALLVGRFDNKKGRWLCAGGLLFEADGYDGSIVDRKLIGAISDVLNSAAPDHESEITTVCGLTGERQTLVSGKFPQPNVPILGQTYLFAKNTAIKANDRYGTFATDAMPVGVETSIRLSAALRSLTSPERVGLTWRTLPGEAPKQTDLLLAFVDTALEAPVTSTMAADDGDFEQGDGTDDVDGIADFEKRAERVVDAVKANVGADITQTPVRVAVFRKVDPANRKVVYSGTPTVASLYDAAILWANGERNVPKWAELPVLKTGERKPRSMSVPHVAPLGMIAFSRSLFVRGGEERQEVTGIPASEALALFLQPVTRTDSAAGRRTMRLLRMVLTRRGCLVIGTAHALRKDLGILNQSSKFWTPFDRREALRTLSVLGVLLLKLNRPKEVYMADAAFRLGQLLAGLDVVHAGYCADVRGGDVPPSLLGNQVFTMAQKAPVKALAMIARRWKPYEGWAGKVARDRGRIDGLVNSKEKKQLQRGWEIRKALRHAREIRGLADELATELRDCRPDDVFRAELLLGYMAGLPAAEKKSDSNTDESSSTEA